jgi:hypothetical protein
MHGRDAFVEEVLEWRPFESFTTRTALPMPGAPRITLTNQLTPRPDGGTDVEVRVGPPRARDRQAFDQVMTGVGPMIQDGAVALQDLLSDEARRIAEERRASPEPAVATSLRRHATQPVARSAANVDSAESRSSRP